MICLVSKTGNGNQVSTTELSPLSISYLNFQKGQPEPHQPHMILPGLAEISKEEIK